MLYRKYRPGSIKIETSAVTSTSEQVRIRLDRIADNYRQLDEIWGELQQVLPQLDQERLASEASAINATESASETSSEPNELIVTSRLRRGRPR